jgi:hypothetical protein
VKIKSQKDFFSGLMFSAVGAAFALGATTYTVGNGARMGPGYFPLMLGILLAIPGGHRHVQSPGGGNRWGRQDWKVCLETAVLCHRVERAVRHPAGGLPSLKIPAMGLVAAIYGLTVVASLAGERFNLKEVLILATILSIGSYLAFIVLLKLQFPVWPTFITG